MDSMAGAMTGEAESLAFVAFAAFITLIRLILFACRLARNRDADVGGAHIFQMPVIIRTSGGSMREHEAPSVSLFCDTVGDRTGAHRGELVVTLDANLPDATEGSWFVRNLLKLVKVGDSYGSVVVAGSGEVTHPRVNAMVEHTLAEVDRIPVSLG